MTTKHWTTDSHNILSQATKLSSYNKWMMGNFRKYFGKAILEIGSGIGALSVLLPHSSIVILTDIVDEYLEVLKQKFTDPVIKLDIEKESPEDLHEMVDTIFSSNVFEHIKNDKDAFLNSFEILESGGKLLLFVPACPSIYNKLDEEMGHYRRYTKKELLQKAVDAGFKVVDIYYANLIGYFLWWGRGTVLSRLIKTPSGISKTDGKLGNLFDSFIVPLLNIEKYIRPPFGQSLVLIAEKP